MQHQFGVDSEEAWELLSEAIPIVHVHGTLGEYPAIPYGNRQKAHERLGSIKLVHEAENATPNFKRASKLLNEADQVVAIGFGFGEDNVRRLNFFRECSNDSREIKIAAGRRVAGEDTKRSERWLSRWGLQREQHVYFVDANQFFSRYPNPFV